jgi:hypothetical protein
MDVDTTSNIVEALEGILKEKTSPVSSESKLPRFLGGGGIHNKNE